MYFSQNLNIKKIKIDLNNKGYSLIKNYFRIKEINLMKKDFFLLSKKLFDYHVKNKRVNFKIKKNGFDSYINYSYKKKNNFNSRFYEVVKKLASFQNLIFYKKNFFLLNQIDRNAKWGMLNKAFGFRFDYPRDNKFTTQLHQDYTSNLGSSSGFVFISSLSKIKKNDGAIKVYPGTHKLGLQKIKVIKNKKIRKTRRQLLADATKIKKKFKFNYVYMNPGDLLILDFLTLHESSQNKSTRTRITFISRYIDFFSGTGTEIFYSDGEQANIFFNKVHKNLII
jgi:hypothetical protein